MVTSQKITEGCKDFQDFLFERTIAFQRNITQGFENLWKWLPIIWKDRQWDHQFIYQVFRHKLHLTEQLIRHDGIHLYHIRDADKIKLCINLLDRLIEDEYHETAFKPHRKKWGTPNFDWIEAKDHPDMTQLKITHPNVQNAKDEEKQSKDFRRCSKDEVKLREQDLDLLFKLIRKHIQSWWD